MNNATAGPTRVLFFYQKTAEFTYPIMKTNIIIGGHYYVKIC